MNNKSHTSGFTLIELMIVVSVIAVIAAIAIPNLLRSRLAANESSAAGAMRTISTSEVAFQQTGFQDADGDGAGDYGTLPQLADPDGGGATEPFIDDVLGAGQKAGYTFTVNVVPGDPSTASTYTAIASPVSQNNTGVRQFFVDETGVIRYTIDGSIPTVTSSPLN